MISGRKGNVFDMLIILVVIGIAVGAISIVVILIDSFNTAIQGSDLPSEGKEFIGTVQSQNHWTMDFILVMLLFALPIASAILAFFDNIPPFLFWASIGLWLLVVVVANIIGDAYSAMVEVDGFSTIPSALPITDFIMTHFVMYAMFSIIMVSFAVFAKQRSLGGYS